MIEQRNIIIIFREIIKRVDLLNNIKAIWLYINRNSVKEINFIKKFKNS